MVSAMPELHEALIGSVVALLEADTAAGGLKDATNVGDGVAWVHRISREGDKNTIPIEGGHRRTTMTVNLRPDDLIAQGRSGAAVLGVVSVHTPETVGFTKQDAVVSRIRAVLNEVSVDPSGWGACLLICLTGQVARSPYPGHRRFDVPFRTVITRD